MSKESISSITGARGATGKTTNSFAGKWALITGASSGLGLEFADLLAAQKVNLILAARRQEPMEKLASDLRRKYGVDVVVEPIDLASPGAASRIGMGGHIRNETRFQSCQIDVSDSGNYDALRHVAVMATRSIWGGGPT
jgi:short-subunit dehydrogenase